MKSDRQALSPFVKSIGLLLCLAGMLCLAPAVSAQGLDFTAGGTIPDGHNHDWNLGPTGARGWMYSEKMVTNQARQIYITEVAEGSPADGVLQVGDVILGVAGERFSYDPRTEMGTAITHAESDLGRGRLTLLRWRDGRARTVMVQLPVLGDYSDTAPFDCPKSQLILEMGCRALAQEIADPGYRPAHPIVRSLNALALLASGDPAYRALLKREAAWAASFEAGGLHSWAYGYVTIYLAEYALATGDETVLPGLRRLAMEIAQGQSIVGSWGHRFALADGRLGGYGMMNSTGIPLTIGLVLAQRAGVTDLEVSEAIDRSARLVRFYTGKGSVPYGDHAPWIQTHGDNGKNEMAAVLFNLLREQGPAEFFSRMAVASHGPERDEGHTGNFFNMTWAMPGVALSGPQATGAWMQEFGQWYFDLARNHDGSFSHLGPPQQRKDSYHQWDCSGAYLLAYAMPLRRIMLTGKQEPIIPQLNRSAARQLIDDGRGWDHRDRHSFYDALSEDELLDRLGSWSPIVRERAAVAIGRKRADFPVDPVLRLLERGELDQKIGACSALAELRGKAAPAVPALRETLKAEDLWLRIKAAEALAAIGDPAMLAVPDLLSMLAQGPTEQDPRNMQQRYLSFSVFGQMLKRSIDGVDRELLRQAIVAGLQNEDGRARGAVGNIYDRLTYEEIKPLLPAIHDAIATPAPSGIMFAAGVRLAGLDLLAKHRIREGMELCIDVMEPDVWGKDTRIPRALRALAQYKGAAKPMIPRLRELEQEMLAHREAERNLKPFIEQTRKLIEDIENSTDVPELRSIND